MTDAAAPSRNKIISNPYIHRLQRRHFLLFDIAPIIGTVVALALLPFLPFGATEIALLAGMWLVSGLGITVGYHRLFTHRTFKAPPFVEAMLAITGSMAGQGGVVSWVAIHRRHHEFSDRDGDPHSPNLSGDGLRGVLRGLVHSHFLWMRRHEYPNIAHYAPDLLRNRRLVNVSRHYYWWFALGVAVPTVIGGLVHLSWQGALAGLLWGGFVRVFLLEHIIWAINSFLHRWGSKPYDSRENSRNGAVFSLLTFGESWHNNHHAFPSSPNFGLQWYRPDPGYWLIRGLSAVGLASDLKNPAAEQIAAKRIRTDERKAAA
ncbi:acyl-CoA desaturase [Pseudonocardia alni]|jgi:stearoyl-CoA desaturase (delta-9 desaturase)|uniref:acyl-CoA desaturase n=1 Tax=Pseudonocardia TaxID=1847 RepID=UPI0020979F06|nr:MULTISPECIES: fatty acid desaturase [Pseudonocardia]MCO7192042.1 fatty acid desaturase [Pseudonocardia sp. McavD-2-B]WFG47233.1 acyl-CoA desaturase [Pseudonocardia alni]